MTDDKVEHPIPDDEWEAIVRNVPIFSIDLIVEQTMAFYSGNGKTNRPKASDSFRMDCI